MERLQCLGHHHGGNCIRLPPALQGKSTFPTGPMCGPSLPSPELPGALAGAGCVQGQTILTVLAAGSGPGPAPPGRVRVAGADPTSSPGLGVPTG